MRLPFVALLALTLHAVSSPPARAQLERVPILLDADPGIDDSMAILFALRSPALEVLGITTVFGNAGIEDTTRNALRLVELAGADVPVVRGASAPLVLPWRPPPDFVHGKDGIGNVNAPPPRRKARSGSAAEFLVATARERPGEITLVAVGRLTNLALALELEPRLPELVKEVVVMGGAVAVPGNVSPVTEANIGGDPHAADRVLTAGWPLALVGLDVTTKVRLTDERLSRLADADETVGGFLWRISRFYRSFYESTGVTGGFYVHDPSAVAYVIDRSLFSTFSARVRVATEGIAIGQTIAARGPRAEEWEPWKGRPAIDVCEDVDGERVVELFEATIRRGAAPPER